MGTTVIEARSSKLKKEEVLADIGGHVNEELLLRNEYLAAEHVILRSKIQGRLMLRIDS